MDVVLLLADFVFGSSWQLSRHSDRCGIFRSLSLPTTSPFDSFERIGVRLLMAKIRRSPVEVGSLSHYLQGLYIPGGAGLLPSTVGSTLEIWGKILNFGVETPWTCSIVCLNSMVRRRDFSFWNSCFFR